MFFMNQAVESACLTISMIFGSTPASHSSWTSLIPLCWRMISCHLEIYLIFQSAMLAAAHVALYPILDGYLSIPILRVPGLCNVIKLRYKRHNMLSQSYYILKAAPLILIGVVSLYSSSKSLSPVVDFAAATIYSISSPTWAWASFKCLDFIL